MASHIASDKSDISELLELLKIDDYENVIKLLKNNDKHANNLFIKDCLIVAYIKKELYSEALTIIENIDIESRRLSFLKMYCLYKKNDLKTVSDELKKLKDLDIKEKDLLCQTLYRLEDFDSMIQTSNSLMIETIKDDYEQERNTNLMAAYASNSLWLNKEDTTLVELDPKKIKNYELEFNYASYYIGISQYEKALLYLDEAEKILEVDAKEENLNISELNQDRCILGTQRAYILIKLGRIAEAKELLALSLKLGSNFNQSIILNNLTALNKSLSWFDVKKKIKHIGNGMCDSTKFSKFQIKTILFNEYLLYDLTNKPELAQSVLDKYKAEITSTDEYSILMDVFSKIKSKVKTTSILDYLQSFIDSSSELSIVIYLTLFEISRAAGDKIKCYEIINKISIKYYNITIIVYYFAFYLQQHFSISHSLAYLETIISYLDEKGINDENILYLAAFLSTKKREFVSGLKYLQKLQSFPEKNIKVAVLMKLYESINVSEQNNLSYIGLTPADIFPTGFDLDELEKSISTYRRNRSTTTNEQKTQLNASSKPKRKRKNKLPKHFDPSVLPNPERWLPKYQRSNYKPKKKDKAKFAGKGSLQGSTQTDVMETISNNTQKASHQSPAKPPGAVNKNFKSKGRNKR